MNSDIPFVRRGGETEDAALHNRIAAIKRIEFLSGVDLSKKSADYLRALDLEMWMRWYREEDPKKPIDEEFCQRSAEVIRAMEGGPVELNEKLYEQEKTKHQIKQRGTNVNQHAPSGSENVGRSTEQS